MTFRAIMNFAADKQYIRERQVPKGKLLSDKARREEFTPQEYRHLHTFARRWIKEAKHDGSAWYRNMAYNFMLVMTNTGMRTMEAANLRWRDIDIRTDKQGRPFVCINVRGKGKFRELVAAHNVASYLERIKAISKATKPDDFVFTTHAGKTRFESLWFADRKPSHRVRPALQFIRQQKKHLLFPPHLRHLPPDGRR